MNKTLILAMLFLIFQLKLNAQNLLTKEQAVTMALDSNYNIKLAQNNAFKAYNSASFMNSAYLPKLTLNSGVSMNNNNLRNEFSDETFFETKNANSANFNSSLMLSYTLYDGAGRSYNYMRMKEMYNLSEIDARIIIENTLLFLFSAYYDVAGNTENEINLKASMEISENRLNRVKYNYEYGKTTKLDVLNAEVDFNNDKIRYLSVQKMLKNSKHNLNLILGRSIDIDFVVDTTVVYHNFLSLDSLIASSKKYNAELQSAQKNIEIQDLILSETRSDFMPVVELYGAYAYNNTYNDENFTYAYSMVNGFNAGINLRWNIFDGGKTKIASQNAKISAQNSLIQKKQAEQDLEREIRNLWEEYNNSLFVLNAEKKNVETNYRNFEKTEEQYKLGQVSSIEYRQAQMNLLNAQTNYNKAKYDAKMTELQLLQLSGNLLDYKF